MEKIRCSWGNSKNSLYRKYHDEEWGKLNLDSTYLYEMFIPEPINHHPKKMEDVPASNELSNQISKEMKNLGFKFVGPITIYSFLQAVGLINDHIENCSFKNGEL